MSATELVPAGDRSSDGGSRTGSVGSERESLRAENLALGRALEEAELRLRAYRAARTAASEPKTADELAEQHPALAIQTRFKAERDGALERVGALESALRDAEARHRDARRRLENLRVEATRDAALARADAEAVRQASSDAVAEAALALARAEAARDEDRARFGEALDAAALDAAATLRRAEAGFDADRVRFDDDRTQFAVAVAECRAQVERRERAAFRAIAEANAARRFADEAKCVGAVEKAKADARRDVFEVLRGMGRPSAEDLLEREENEDDGFGTRKEDGDDDGDARDPGTPAGFRRMPQEPSTPPPRWAAWARSWERERAGRRLADARRDARAYRQTLRGLD